jgi:four helix bundle protein
LAGGNLDHKDLDVWKAGIELSLQIYEITKDFPREEIYSLTSQLRRAAVSVPSNVAEGAARNGDKEFIQFLYISLGSLAEVETQLIIAEKLGYINQTFTIHEKISAVKKMILGLIKYLRGKGLK